VTPDATRSQMADEFRVIKRPLLANVRGKPGTSIKNANMIMVTSALPSEGKSFTALNLAMSIVMEMDNTVMLVDADVANPSLLKLMGLPPAKGLLDILTNDGLEPADVILRTNVPKLSILPAGTPHPRATEVLASDAMAQLVNEMALRYSDRIVIFDSPPLLPTTEARALATHMGQVVLVVAADKTTHRSVTHALATIEQCPVVMMLLNKATTSSEVGSYYGYGYGYGYEGAKSVRKGKRDGKRAANTA
jgi:protein-tyrosine kinase